MPKLGRAKNNHSLQVEQLIITASHQLFELRISLLPALWAKLLDLNMLVMAPGGCQRTEAEYRSLFEKAGFKLTRIVPTQEDVSLIEGIRV